MVRNKRHRQSDGTDLHMIATGETELIVIDEYFGRPTDDLEAARSEMMREMQTIEDHVKAHPAAG